MSSFGPAACAAHARDISSGAKRTIVRKIQRRWAAFFGICPVCRTQTQWDGATQSYVCPAELLALRLRNLRRSRLCEGGIAGAAGAGGSFHEVAPCG